MNIIQICIKYLDKIEFLLQHCLNIQVTFDGEYCFLRALLTYFSEVFGNIFFYEYYLNIQIIFT